MKTLKTQIPIVLILLSISFLCASCERDAEGHRVTYYKTTGEGYVFMYDKKDGNILYPIQNAEIEITSVSKRSTSALFSYHYKQTYYSDATGKYTVRFPKRYGMLDVIATYYIDVRADFGGRPYGIKCPFRDSFLYVDEVKNAKNNKIVFDTTQIYLFEY